MAYASARYHAWPAASVNPESNGAEDEMAIFSILSCRGVQLQRSARVSCAGTVPDQIKQYGQNRETHLKDDEIPTNSHLALYTVVPILDVGEDRLL